MAKRALLIGIDTYPDPRNNLNSCVADTVRFQNLLQTYYGFQQQDIALLHNSAATLANARTGLTRLFSGIRAGDQVVFFQSSHGYRYVQGTTYTEVLCLYDAFLADTELVQLSGQTPPARSPASSTPAIPPAWTSCSSPPTACTPPGPRCGNHLWSRPLPTLPP